MPLSECEPWIAFESSAPGRLRRANGDNMKKAMVRTADDELRDEYDLSGLKGGVRGKYFKRATADTARAALPRPRRRR